MKTLLLRLGSRAMLFPMQLISFRVSSDGKWKIQRHGLFSYTFEKIQNEIVLQIEASGFLSDVYTIQLINRPELTQLKATLDYPAYLNRKSEQLNNAGNLEIPEGTKVTWQIGASNTSKATMLFSSDQSQNEMQLIDNESFKFSKNFNDPEQYSIVLENDHSKNKDQINYSIGVIKDQFPQIVVENLQRLCSF